MKVSRERYQHGSVRKVPRSQGFAWEFRFYITAPDGKRKLKVQTFDSVKYPTERDVRKAVEGQLSALNAGTLGGKVAATLGTIIDRYMAGGFPHPPSLHTDHQQEPHRSPHQAHVGRTCGWPM